MERVAARNSGRPRLPARRLVAVVLLCMAATGCAAKGDAGAQPSVTPLREFVDSIADARYADFAGRDGVAVRDEAAFEQMRGYLLDRYRPAVAAGTVAIGGAVFDCLRAIDSALTPPSPGTPPRASAPPGPAEPGPAVCPGGSVPVRRVTLDELVRFATLADFLGKGPPGEGLPPTSGP